jgi:signal transduction histidine kinase
VSYEHLGLFDTPPDRQQIRLSFYIIGLLFGALLVVLPMHEVQLGRIDAFVPAIDSIMCVAELIIATLLYAQAAVFRSRALTVLASGYLFASLLLIPHALTFPGAFAPQGLLGAGLSTSAWLATFRRLAFPIAIIFYVLLKSADAAEHNEAERATVKVSSWLIVAVGFAVLATLLATYGQDWLPPFFVDRRQGVFANLMIMNATTIGLTVAAMVLLFRQPKSLLDLWLLVALSAWLAQSLLNLPLHARFMLGWYGLFSLMLASSLVVMIALVVESNRLYGRLAISAASRNREQNSRAMSVDAVIDAVSHEVGQPLVAINLSASASLGWLTRKKPDVDMAIRALEDTIEAGKRTFEVIRGIRAMSTRGLSGLSEFSLNDLVRETATLLDRELVAQRVTLEFDLDGSMPAVQANRVQIQRVLVNLLTNAIESLAATHHRPRRIVIRTSNLEDEGVLVEITDSGVGIAADRIAKIFQPFHTSKASGRGLGLSLSQTIVDEHGGRLWVTAGEPHGATFSMQLRRSSAPREQGEGRSDEPARAKLIESAAPSE